MDLSDVVTTKKPWIPHKPEQRFSLWLNRFLEHALIQPCYFTANQDADSGGLTDQQRSRNIQRGIKSGQLDWEIEQLTPNGHLFRRLELKRGKNAATDMQKVTITKLMECGAAPEVAYNIRQAHSSLARMGFLFTANVETLIQKYEGFLEASDREADAILRGAAVKVKHVYPTMSKPRAGRGTARARRFGAAAQKP